MNNILNLLLWTRRYYLVLTLFITLVICFVTDSIPTVAEDTTDKSIDMHL
jgi:hypothetical protein